MSQFFESNLNGIRHHYVKFSVSHINYVMDFTDDADVILSLMALGEDIAELLRHRKVYTVKFAVEEYFEQEDYCGDLYAPPKNHQFGKTEINDLKNQLETLLLRHYKVFHPECYFFIAERESLRRMYTKMCHNRNIELRDFIPLTGLGADGDCFILQTPHFKENV